MKVAVQQSARTKVLIIPLLAVLAIASGASATTQLVLTRDTHPEGEFKGIVELTVTPPADNTKVSITVDGDKLAEALLSPYRVSADFGPRVVEHRISVTALTSDRKRVQWSTTINKGHL